MMHTRREFLRYGSYVSVSAMGAAGLAPILVHAAELSRTEQVLVVVFLRGGNDGLNTVIPYRDPLYAKHRPTLRIEPSQVLSISEELGLHPSLRDLAKLWEEGCVTIVQGVGYPNHLRSHFESTAVWHAGRLHARPNSNDGWLGRALDTEQSLVDAPLAVSFGGAETPVPLRGRRLRTTSPVACYGDEARRVARALGATKTRLPADDARTKAVIVLRDDARKFLLSTAPNSARRTGSESPLASQLLQAARMIATDNPARVYYVEHAATEGNGGYDTHSAQRQPHAALLADLGSALSGLVQQLRRSGDDGRVTVLVFSEFGRRVAENGSRGTDHGAAGPVILLRPPGSGGIVGPTPDLEHLDNGDVAVTVDFRHVYARLLEDVFQIDSGAVLGEAFEPRKGSGGIDNLLG